MEPEDAEMPDGEAEEGEREEAKEAPNLREAQPSASEVIAEYELDMETEPLEIDVSEGVIDKTAKPAGKRTGTRKGGKGK